MKKAALSLLLLVAGLLRAESLKVGQFEADLQEDNALLPGSIRWIREDVELLKPKTGVNASFVSFEFHNKIYHDENNAIWAGKNEPRFFTDATVSGKAPRTDGEFTGIRVDLESSYASCKRSLLFHQTEPRVRIEYAFVFTRDVVLHETGSLEIGFQFNAGFDGVTVCDARETNAAPLTATGLKGDSYSVSLLNAGPKLLTHSGKKIGLLVRSSHAGPGLENPPVRLLILKKGQTLALSAEWLLARQDDPALQNLLRESGRAQPASTRPFMLLETARALARLGRLPEAEAALLLSGRLSPDYAAPYGELAGLRRDYKLPGEGDAWVEAGYRMPYNYGYMLSGSGFADRPEATEEQRRQHQFNLLIAVENNALYPDYYLWAARGFLRMNMTVQACAMYRQALWAADLMPRREETRQKLKQEIRKKIAELEAAIKDQSCTNLPPLIPVRIIPRQP